MSSEDSFSSLGKIEAINNLLSSAGLKRESSFSPTNGSLVKSAGRIFLEGIDFDLIYFPLPHLGYKCVVAVTGEIFAALAHPRVLQVRLGVSAKLDYKNIQELFKGIVAERVRLLVDGPGSSAIAQRPRDRHLRRRRRIEIYRRTSQEGQ